MALQIIQALPTKGTTGALQPLSGTTLKDTGKGKLSQWAEVQAVHMIIHFDWEEKWPEVLLLNYRWANGLAEWIG